MEEEQPKKEAKKRLSPDATVLLTIGAMALAVVVYRILYFCITGN